MNIIHDALFAIGGAIVGYFASFFINRNNPKVAAQVNAVVDKVESK